MRVLVCGGRTYNDYWKVVSELDKLKLVECVIHGDAQGADQLAGKWAGTMGIQVVKCPAMWDAHGPAAGPRRNAFMLTLNPDLVVAFPGGKGTDDMKKQARKAGIEVRVVK